MKGLCKCGCGQKTNIVPKGKGNKTVGHIEGQHYRFVCGHFYRNAQANPKFRHGIRINGKCTPEYTAWKNMRQRCYDPNSSFWKFYGGRGIKVCPRWRGRTGFQNFLKDVGPKPIPKRSYSLGRLKISKGYSPVNCEWQTWHIQNLFKNKTLGA